MPVPAPAGNNQTGDFPPPGHRLFRCLPAHAAPLENQTLGEFPRPGVYHLWGLGPAHAQGLSSARQRQQFPDHRQTRHHQVLRHRQDQQRPVSANQGTVVLPGEGRVRRDLPPAGLISPTAPGSSAPPPATSNSYTYFTHF